MDHGIQINWLAFSNEETGEELCKVDWNGVDPFKEEMTVTLPTSVVKCGVVNRAMSFSSKEEHQMLRIQQKVLLGGEELEAWNFTFGYVIPNSTNTWTATMKAAPDMIPPEALSGNMVIESLFINNNTVFARQTTRCFFS